jgi:hypothetical protein
MYLPDSDDSAKIVQHGEIGPLAVGPKFVIITSCHAVQDESRKLFTPLDAYTARPPPSSDLGAGLSLETYHKYYDLAVQFASSNLIPTTAAYMYLTDDDFDTFDPLAIEKMTNCLHEGKNCYGKGYQIIMDMDEATLSQVKHLVQDSLGVSLPDDLHDLKNAYRILYQRRLRLTRQPEPTGGTTRRLYG